MKQTKRIVMAVAVAALLLAVGGQLANAACPPGETRTFDFRGVYLVSNPNWAGAGGTNACAPYLGCYDSVSGPPISDNIDGFFWGQGGQPNEAVLTGIDSGTWPVRQWVKQASIVFDELYHYPAFISANDGDVNGWGQPGSALSWAGSDLIDDCISNITPAVNFDECHCLLLTDEWDGQGYFAMFSQLSDAGGTFAMNEQQVSTFTMAPIPQPQVTQSDEANAVVTTLVNVPTPTAGDFRSPSCDCGFGFRVYAAVMPEGGMPPSSRTACTQRDVGLPYNDPGFAAACRAAGFVWIPALDLTGNQQPVTGFDAGRATTGVSVDCGDPALGYDVYLATGLGTGEGASGVQLANVSTNSFQVKCGNYQLAEPDRPQRPEATTPGRSGDAPRGRDNNRSRER